jgi:hypothetical protein
MRVAWHEVPGNRHNGAARPVGTADRSANPKGILQRSLCARRFEKRQQEIEIIGDSANVFRMEPYREQKLDHCSRYPSWDGQAMRSDRIDRPSGTVRSFSLFQALRARLLSLKSLRDRLLSLNSLWDRLLSLKSLRDGLLSLKSLRDGLLSLKSLRDRLLSLKSLRDRLLSLKSLRDRLLSLNSLRNRRLLLKSLRDRLLSLNSLRARLLSLNSLRDKAVRTKPTNRVKLTLIGLGFPDPRLRR